MARRRVTAVWLALVLAAAAPRIGLAALSSAPTQRASRFELTFVPVDRPAFVWRTAWPLLRSAGPPLLTVDGSEVVAYDSQRQLITLDVAVTRRLVALLPTMRDENLHKLKALWRPIDLWLALSGTGFVVRLDGQPLYGGLVADSSPSIAYAVPLAHPGLDAARRIVLEIELGAYADAWSPRDASDMAKVAQRMADPRLGALFAALPATAPPGPTGVEPPIAPPTGVALNLTRRYHGSRDTDWDLQLDFADPDAVAEVGLRWGTGEAAGPFHEFLLHPYLAADTVPAERVRPGPQTVEVVLTDQWGRRTAPIPFTVDFAAQALAEAKYDLLRYDNSWVTFHPGKRCDGPCLDFGGAFAHRDVLLGVRYSLDGCTLDRIFPFPPWTDLGHEPEWRWEDKTSVAIPAATTSACVQLVYRDGEVSERRRFDVSPP